MLKKIITGVLIITVVLFAFALYYWYTINKTGSNPNITNLTIEKGETIDSIAEQLKTNGLISSGEIFKLYLYLNNDTNKIKAGAYQFSGRNSIIGLTQLLKAGENKSNTTRVKIIEGWSLRDINDYLVKNNSSAKEDFLALTSRQLSDWQFDFPKPSFISDAPAQANLEGYLFPDTYEIFNNADSGELIKKMLDNMDLKLGEDIRNEIKRQHKSIYEILTMASIIQREVKTGDMPLVSGIFWRRLQGGVRLGSDATLAYALGENKEHFSSEDTMVNSPYNTYRNGGLPPGPISNPGLDAIKAALYPKESNYLYFLSRPDTGETVFSVTLDEHNQNKAKYLK